MSTNPLLSQPTRIAFSGDWHGQSWFAAQAIDYAAEQGAAGIVQLGDFGIWPGIGGRFFLDAIEQKLQERGLWCVFIDGNHEDFWQLESLPIGADGLRVVRPGLWHIPRGTRWTWAGRTWVGVGGATSLDRKHRRLGRDWWPQESITTEQMDHVIAGGRAEVMISHDCPAGVDIPGLLPDSFWDADEMRRAKAHQQIMLGIAEAVQPSYLFHGHFHVRYDTTVAFAGTPCHVVGLAGNHESLRENTMIVDLDALP